MRPPSAKPYIWAAALIALAIWGLAGAPQMSHTASNIHVAKAR
jgi:hypothetical protein